MKTFIFCFSALIAAGWLWAIEPISQPTNFTGYNITSYSFQISFTGSDADKYIVLRSTSPITDIPYDGTEYTQGEWIGNSKVFYSGNDTNVLIREVYAGLTYYFSIFAFNGSGINCDYKSDNPLTGTVVTPVSMEGNYYSIIDPNSPSFLTDLKLRLNTGKVILPYYEYGDYMVDNFFEYQNGNGEKYVICEYSNEQYLYYGNFDFGSADYSREHSMPRSWMRTSASVYSSEGADYHNLYLTNYTDVNAPRSNYPYGEVESIYYSYLDFKLGFNNLNDLVNEPTESLKGDVARSLFYMIVCYNGLNGNWGFNNLNAYGNQQDVDLLLNWHRNDPPDPKERAKHEIINSFQKNRNPFIDHPDWVDCINFKNVSRYPNCVYSVTGEESYSEPIHIQIYPNPASEFINITYTGLYDEVCIRLRDINGRLVEKKLHEFNNENEYVQISLAKFTPGMYILEIQSSKFYAFHKLLIQN